MIIIQIRDTNSARRRTIEGYGREGEDGGYFEFEFAELTEKHQHCYHVTFARNERSGTRYGYSVPKHEAKIVGEL